MKIDKTIRLAYLIALCLLTVSLPFSFYTTSISVFILLTIWITGLFVFPYKKRLKNNKEVWLFVLIFIIHVLWLWNTTDFDYAFTDLKKKLPLLVLPVIIASMPSLGRIQRNIILNIFILAMIVSGFLVFAASQGIIGNADVNPSNYSLFVNHIRLSLMMSLAIFISGWLFVNTDNKYHKLFYIFSILVNIAILLILQVLNGIIISIIVSLFLIIKNIKTIQKPVYKYSLISLIIIIPLLSSAYLYNQLHKFYNPQKEYPDNYEIKTKKGNSYKHIFNSEDLENGNYIYRFLCIPELKKTWNKKSKISFDSLDKRGHKIKHTLIRYLTSKGELKDSEGVKSLTKEEIKAIENGATNSRFKGKNNINERIYSIIWQLHSYFNGKNPSGKTIPQRIEYQKTGWKIAANNFFTGVGTGDVDKTFKEQYRIDKSPLIPQFRRRTHNQYLTILVATGIIGFIIFLIAWFITPAFKNAYKNYFFIVFFIIASVSMLAEDTLETLTGITFISYFYSLFLWGINYKSMYQEKLMKKAVKLAKDNIPSGNGPFGAVIVKDNEIIAEAPNSVTKDNDPTAHAEINAIRQACNNLNTFDLSGCEIYSSCEPCPMCLGAIYWSRLDKLYFAASRKDAANAGFSDDFIYNELNKNINDRNIATRQIMKEEGKSVFKSWDEYEDKILY